MQKINHISENLARQLHYTELPISHPNSGKLIHMSFILDVITFPQVSTSHTENHVNANMVKTTCI